jgi:hypothetical protein
MLLVGRRRRRLELVRSGRHNCRGRPTSSIVTPREPPPRRSRQQPRANGMGARVLRRRAAENRGGDTRRSLLIRTPPRDQSGDVRFGGVVQRYTTETFFSGRWYYLADGVPALGWQTFCDMRFCAQPGAEWEITGEPEWQHSPLRWGMCDGLYDCGGNRVWESPIPIDCGGGFGFYCYPDRIEFDARLPMGGEYMDLTIPLALAGRKLGFRCGSGEDDRATIYQVLGRWYPVLPD